MQEEAPFSSPFNERKHDLIFRAGCEALLDGYEREAVNDFAAAQERSKELFVRTWCHQRFGEDQFEKTWKQMSRQSERQLGDLYIAYGIETGNAYDINTKMVEFRNKVVHQGLIPDQHEVLEYGRYAFNDIRHLIKILEKKHPKALRDAISKEMADRRATIPKGLPVVPFTRTLARLPEGANEAVELADFDELLGVVEQTRACGHTAKQAQ